MDNVNISAERLDILGDKMLEKGFRLACQMLDEMYSGVSTHEHMLGDCLMAKVNLMNTKDVRKNPKHVGEEMNAIKSFLRQLHDKLLAGARTSSSWGSTYYIMWADERHVGQVMKDLIGDPRIYGDKHEPDDDDIVIAIADWEQSKGQGFTNGNGSGYWMKDGYICRDEEVFSSDPKDATHVYWIDK
jgi:hypothetical protein